MQGNKRKENSAVKAISFMMMITILGKVLGLVREQFFANAFGTASSQGQAFFVASFLPRTFLDILFASAISASFIPVFNSRLEKKGRKEAYRFANNFITIISIFAIVVTVVAMFFSDAIVGIMGGTYTAETIALSSKLFTIMLPLVVLSVIAYSLIGILQSLEEFNIPAAMSVVSNGVIIAYYLFFFDKFGIIGLAVTFVIGWGTQVLIQVPFLYQNGYRYRPVIDFKDPGIKEISVLVLPVMVSTWMQPVNQLVNTRVANSVHEEWGVALGYANNLFTIIAGVFVLSVANVIFTKLSKVSAHDDDVQFGETMCATVRSLFYFLTPMMMGFILLSKPVIRIIYERGEFTPASTALTSTALVFYSLGIIGYGLQTILSRGFYAQKDGKTPMIMSVIAIGINALLSFTLVHRLGIGGLALASSVAINAVAILMLFVMYQRNRQVLNRKMFKDLLLICVATSVMGIVIQGVLTMMASVMEYGEMGQLLSIGISVVLAVCVYVLVTRMFGIDEAKVVFSILRKATRKLVPAKHEG